MRTLSCRVGTLKVLITLSWLDGTLETTEHCHCYSFSITCLRHSNSANKCVLAGCSISCCGEQHGGLTTCSE